MLKFFLFFCFFSTLPFFMGSASALEKVVYNDLQFLPPAGWKTQPGAGTNAIFLTSLTSGKKAPVLVSLSLPKVLQQKEMAPFMEKSIKDAFGTLPEFKILKLVQLKSQKSPNIYSEFTFLKEGFPYQGSAYILAGKVNYHLFYFTTGRDLFPSFKKDVDKVYASASVAN